DPGPPDRHGDRLAGEVDLDPLRAPLQPAVRRILVLPLLLLPTVVQPLAEPPPVHQADGDHRYPEVARGLLDAPGEHAQPAGVDTQLWRDAVLHAEVRDPRFARGTGKVAREPLLDRGEAMGEQLVGGQLREP